MILDDLELFSQDSEKESYREIFQWFRFWACLVLATGTAVLLWGVVIYLEGLSITWHDSNMYFYGTVAALVIGGTAIGGALKIFSDLRNDGLLIDPFAWFYFFWLAVLFGTPLIIQL